MKYLFLITLLWSIQAPLRAQKNTFEKFDQYLDVLEEDERFFGSVAVSKGGKVIYSRALGYADIDAKVKNNANTKFRVGSVSKTFTAALIMKAVELGKLKLNDKIDQYFPKIENANKISIEQLLKHRSGIKTFTDRSYFSWHTKPVTREALIDTIIQKGIEFQPDTDYNYSNSNYVLLSVILERAFGDSFDKILNKHIVKPLGLKLTKYGGAINTSKNEARSFRMKDDWTKVEEDHMSIPLGAGGVVSTPSDLCLFLSGLAKGEIFSKESFRSMHPAAGEEYGYALYEIPFEDMKSIGHQGNIDAFSTVLSYFEKEDIALAITCNGSNFPVHDVSLALVNEIFGKAYDLPSFDFVELSDEELDQYLGTYESDDLPMDMIISKKDKTLYLEVTGQSPGPLTSKGDDLFVILQYGVKIKFMPEEGKMLFEQQGMAFELSLKKEEENDKSEVQQAPKTKSALDKYAGVYTSGELPIDLTISVKNGQLIGQGDGQPSFTLKRSGDDEYVNKEIGLTINFDPEKGELNFIQGGGLYKMTKKE